MLTLVEKDLIEFSKDESRPVGARAQALKILAKMQWDKMLSKATWN